MKSSVLRILAVVLFAVPVGVAIAAVPSTVGSNLTAFNNSNMGAINNNSWNAYANARASAASGNNAGAPTADFGNCNALVMRCAQPRCAGCTSMELAIPIVSGCVQSNPSCVQYGNDLVQYMAAQLVANATAKDNAASRAAADAAAQQSAQQLQQMQYQMQAMQAEMAAQNAATVAQLQNALDEQKMLTAQAIADATAASVSANKSASAVTTSDVIANGLTDAQANAVANGVSAEMLVREQITGQIYTAIENAEKSMKDLSITMRNAFRYAGCDERGDNCTGPKRVKRFKDMAMDFFDPYDNVVDEMYDALLLASSIGVDIGDIILMMNDACQMWGRYICSPDVKEVRYTADNCSQSGRTIGKIGSSIPAGVACTIGAMVPQQYGGCQLVGTIDNTKEMRIDWINEDISDSYNTVRIGCISDVLNNSTLFAGRKKQSSIDIDTLKRIIQQDAPAYYGTTTLGNVTSVKSPNPDGIKFCAVNMDTYQQLQQAVGLKALPGEVCVTDNWLDSNVGAAAGLTPAGANTSKCTTNTGTPECKCKNSGGYWSAGACYCDFTYSLNRNGECEFDANAYNQWRRDRYEVESDDCVGNGGVWQGYYCDCKTPDKNKYYDACKALGGV